MDPKYVLDRVRTVTSLPALPVVVRALSRDIANPNSHIQHICRLIGHDQALTARILRVANSPFYATREPVRTLSQAVPLLGLRTVQAMLLRNSLADTLTDRHARGFWLHALGTACASRAIARLARLGRPDEAFALGLLHDIGKLALQEAFPNDYAVARSIVERDNCLIREAEDQIFGLDHAVAGQQLGSRWSLPVEFVEAIGCHHRVAAAGPQGRPWAATAHLADIIARSMLIGNGGDRGMPVLDPLALDTLRLTTADFAGIFSATEEELSLAEVFFNVLDG